MPKCNVYTRVIQMSRGLISQIPAVPLEWCWFRNCQHCESQLSRDYVAGISLLIADLCNYCLQRKLQMAPRLRRTGLCIWRSVM